MFFLDNGKSTDPKSVRNLIVDGVEKYRLINKDTLVYAKGKIKFDINLIKIGNGSKSNKDIDYDKNKNYQEELYAFFGDGFYSYNKEKDKWIKRNITKNGKELGLDEINSLKSNVAEFRGWWTDKEGGQEITTIDHLKTGTPLFEYNSKSSIPTITLYAHWEIKLCEVTFENIKKEHGRSSFNYESYPGHYSTVSASILTDNVGSHTFRVPYGSTLKEVENAHYPKGLGWEGKGKKYTPSYILNTDMFNDTVFLSWSQENAKYFWRGWYTQKDGKGKMINPETFVITKDVTFYPQFDAFIYWKKFTFEIEEGGGYSGSWITEIEPPVKKWSKVRQLEKANSVPCFHCDREGWPTYKWKYPSSDLSLGSGDVLIVETQKV